MNTLYNHQHLIHRIGWLRAANLGVNDGIISIAGLMMGLMTHQSQNNWVLFAGVAALFAGALSMAAGEWASVQSQVDAEHAELELEKQHIANHPEQELMELQHIYEERGLNPDLAMQVAKALTAHDAVESHARDELGITPHQRPNPMAAALSSALAFLAGGCMPLAFAYVAQQMSLPLLHARLLLVLGVLTALWVSGAILAKLSNASATRGAMRLMLWGGVSLLVGWLLSLMFGGSL